MKNEFDLTPEQSRVFLKYFQASMREPNTGFLPINGSGRFTPNGYESKQALSFTYKQKKLFVEWLIKFNLDNSLASIENLTNVGDDNYELTLSEFINTILQKVISQKKSKFFKRVYFRTISGSNLDGEYWLRGFRFAPLFPEDDSKLICSERIFVIDQKVLAIDSSHADEVAKENATKYSSYLSFLLEIKLETPRRQELYFLDTTENVFEMKRQSTQLMDTKLIYNSPRKGEICHLGEYKNSVFRRHHYITDGLTCPTETRRIISKILVAEPSITDAFDRCCLLYQLALNIGDYPTVRISYLCAAVESIVKTNIKEYISFTDFMVKYSGSTDKQLFNFIYSDVRSAHWHSGNLSLGEHDFDDDFLTNPNNLTIHSIIDTAYFLMRTAILNWLNEKIEFTSEK